MNTGLLQLCLLIYSIFTIAVNWNVDVGFSLLSDSDNDIQQDDDHSELDRLERWLIAAETTLVSLRSKPQQLAEFEESLAQYKVGGLHVSVLYVLALL